MSFSWSAFAKVAELVGPLALTAAGVPAGVIPLVVHGIQIAEAASDSGPKTGADKKAIAMDAVQTGLNAVNAVKPGTLDVPQLAVVVGNGIDETVAAIKAAKNIPMAPGPDVIIGGKS
jgi:hypothetical protein